MIWNRLWVWVKKTLCAVFGCPLGPTEVFWDDLLRAPMLTQACIRCRKQYCYEGQIYRGSRPLEPNGFQLNAALAARTRKERCP